MDLFDEMLRLTVATTMARFGSGGFHIVFVPLILVLVPVAASAYGAFRESRRTEHLPVQSRLLAGAVSGVPLALIMLIIAAIAGEDGLGFARAR